MKFNYSISNKTKLTNSSYNGSFEASSFWPGSSQFQLRLLTKFSSWGGEKQGKGSRQPRWTTVSVQFSSVQSLSRVRLFATPWIAARQASPSITNSPSSLRLTSIESVMPSSHRILCRPLLLLPPIPPSTRVFSSESILRTNYSLSPSKYIWRAVVSMGQSPKSRNTGVISCSLIISFQLFIP